MTMASAQQINAIIRSTNVFDSASSVAAETSDTNCPLPLSHIKHAQTTNCTRIHIHPLISTSSIQVLHGTSCSTQCRFGNTPLCCFHYPALLPPSANKRVHYTHYTHANMARLQWDISWFCLFVLSKPSTRIYSVVVVVPHAASQHTVLCCR